MMHHPAQGHDIDTDLEETGHRGADTFAPHEHEHAEGGQADVDGAAEEDKQEIR